MARKDLARQIELHCAWHKLTRTLALFQVLLFASFLAMALCVGLDKLFCLRIDYQGAFALIAGSGLLALLSHHVLASRKTAYVGYLIDRNADLRNLVSSGLECIGSAQEVPLAVVVRAETALAGCSPLKLMPPRLNWAGKMAFVPAGLLIGSFLMPQMDVLHTQERRLKAAAEKEVVRKGAELMVAKASALESLSRSAERAESTAITKDFNALAKEMTALGKEEALLKLGEFESKYAKELAGERDFEKMAKAASIAPDMKGLSHEAQKDLKKLMDNIEQGKLDAAGESLRDLAQRLADANLSADERKALAREMQKLAEKMQGIGCNETLAKLLQQLQASDLDQQALLDQCKQAADRINDLAAFCEECNALKAMKEGLKDAKKAMLGDSFSDFDAKRVEALLAAEAGLGCQERGKGDGTGGPGQGRGGRPPESPTATAFESKKSPSKLNKGSILHQLFVSGVPEKGEALTEYIEVTKAAKEHAASSLAQDKIPVEYENMVKKYFDTLETGKKRGEEQR